LTDKEFRASVANQTGRVAQAGPHPGGTGAARDDDHRIAMNLARTRLSVAEADGLVLAAVDEAGPWQAVRVLRTAMQGLRADGWAPEGLFLTALDRDGRILPARDPDVAVFLLGYRLRPPGPTA
jgi:hypothetical protein